MNCCYLSFSITISNNAAVAMFTVSVVFCCSLEGSLEKGNVDVYESKKSEIQI